MGEYQNAARGLGIQALANTSKPPSPDGLINRLAQIDSLLAESESVLMAIHMKMNGPGGENNNKLAEEPTGVNGLILAINSRSQRVRQALEDLNNFLG